MLYQDRSMLLSLKRLELLFRSSGLLIDLCFCSGALREAYKDWKACFGCRWECVCRLDG